MADEPVKDGQAAEQAPVEESASPKTSIFPDLTPEPGEAAEKPESAPGKPAETPEKPGSEPAAELGDKGKDEIIALRKRAQEAERKAAYLEGLAEGRIKPVEQVPAGAQPPAPLVRPKAEDFDSQEAYEDALLEYADQRTMQRLAQLRETEATKTAVQQIAETYEQRIQEVAKEDPEIVQIREEIGPKLSETIGKLVMESDIPDRLIHYLADHPDQAQRLVKMAPSRVVMGPDGRPTVLTTGNPLMVAREMGRIEAELRLQPAPEKRTTTQAPEPHEPVGGRTGVINVADPDTDPGLSTEDRIKLWNERKARSQGK